MLSFQGNDIMMTSAVVNVKAGLVLLVIAVAVLLTAHYDLGQSDHMVDEVPASRTVEITYSFRVNDIPHNANRIRAWVPVPPTNERQQVHALRVLKGLPYQIIEENQYGNRFLFFDIAEKDLPAAGELDVSVVFRVTRYATNSLRRSSPSEALPKHQLARYLSADRLIPIDGRIAKEAHQTAGHVEDPLGKSRLLYDHIVSTLTYDKSGTGWGRGDAIYACDVRRGNCTDFHSLFIGQARALGISARFIMGLPLPENETEGTIPGYHCWAEFYLPEKGWLPIDASEASRHPEKKEMLFGGLDEHRVAFTLGRDIKLPGSAAEPLNYAIYSHVEIDGRVHGNVLTTFVFRDQPNQSQTTEEVAWGKFLNNRYFGSLTCKTIHSAK